MVDHQDVDIVCFKLAIVLLFYWLCFKLHILRDDIQVDVIKSEQSSRPRWNLSVHVLKVVYKSWLKVELKIIQNTATNHLQDNLLLKYQQGLVQGRSCTTQR